LLLATRAGWSFALAAFLAVCVCVALALLWKLPERVHLPILGFLVCFALHWLRVPAADDRWRRTRLGLAVLVVGCCGLLQWRTLVPEVRWIRARQATMRTVLADLRRSGTDKLRVWLALGLTLEDLSPLASLADLRSLNLYVVGWYQGTTASQQTLERFRLSGLREALEGGRPDVHWLLPPAAVETLTRFVYMHDGNLLRLERALEWSPATRAAGQPRFDVYRVASIE
jgi:hypothetical protein